MLRLNITPEQNIYFVSDLHLNHANICRGTSKWRGSDDKLRDFDTLDEMNSTIISNINKVVRSTDILIDLGDILFGPNKPQNLENFLSQINCKNHIYLYGNHDDWLRHNLSCQLLFNHCVEYLELVVDCKDCPTINFNKSKKHKRLFILCHYAFKVFRDSHHDAINLYGHSHSTLPDDPKQLSLDVGVDTYLFGHKKFTPYSIQEIIYIMDNFKESVPVDHHTDLTN